MRYLFLVILLSIFVFGCGTSNQKSKSDSNTVLNKLDKSKFAKPSPIISGKEIINPLSDGKKLKAAFIYVGPIGDAGWTFSHDQARKQIENEFNIETSYIENIPEGADCERILNQYAQKGYNLIFATSFGYMDSVINVSKKFPNTIFMHCSGYKRAKNVGTYFGRMYQAKFLAGVLAGKMTKSNIIGYIGPHPIPEVIRHLNAYAIGAKSVNPKVKVRVIWTNSWYNPGIEKEAAMSLIDANSDVIATGADSVAPLQAAQERGVFAIGYDSDGSKFAPKSYLTSPIWNWEIIYSDIIKKIQNKNWKSCDYWDGINTGIVQLVKLSKLVPENVKKVVNEFSDKIKLGKIKVFKGEIKDNTGKIIYKNGQIPTDSELLKMNFLYENIIGSIPK